MANHEDMFYENSFLVDQCLKNAAVYIQDSRWNAVMDLNVATSPDAIFCCCYRDRRVSLESLQMPHFLSYG